MIFVFLCLTYFTEEEFDHVFSEVELSLLAQQLHFWKFILMNNPV